MDSEIERSREKSSFGAAGRGGDVSRAFVCFREEVELLASGRDTAEFEGLALKCASAFVVPRSVAITFSAVAEGMPAVEIHWLATCTPARPAAIELTVVDFDVEPDLQPECPSLACELVAVRPDICHAQVLFVVM